MHMECWMPKFGVYKVKFGKQNRVFRGFGTLYFGFDFVVLNA